MTSLLRSFLFQVSAFLPQAIIRLPYTLSLYCLNTCAYFYGFQFYARNSFVSRNMVLGLSDLDITVLLEGKNKFEESKKVLKIYGPLKVVFPYIGELNIIWRSELPMFIHCLNCFEAQRDPFLSRLIKKERPEGNLEEKSFFIIKMLNSDINNLIYRFDLRKKKWKNHIDLSSECDDIYSLLALISAQTSFTSNGLRLEEYYRLKIENLKRSPSQWYDLCLQKSYLLELIFFDLNIWMGECFLRRDLEKYRELIQELPKKQSELLKECFKWEIWGQFTQLAMIEGEQQKEVFLHLSNLKDVLGVLDPNDTEILDPLSHLMEIQLEFMDKAFEI